ncbi:uncharacterized protein LOC126672281 [Mercurialis annua]|uniref:uncharacterized protein LOC126672281 n=1 Tax=Mercurialis annua TaxID=3986 RepID=UPI00215F9A49|nr:uncharacterized protein LOC126672281 [Mercurialis annua]
MDPNKKRDESKYCRFHEGYGHDTDRCWDLKREIEQLIQSGVLRKFVHEKFGEKKEGRRCGEGGANRKAKEVTGVIHVIDGGEPYSNTQKKKRNRRRSATVFVIEREIAQEVSFGPEVGGHVQGPHNDALVIEAVIRNHSSQADLDRLRKFYLRKASVPLIGLGGKPIRPEGTVSIYVELGEKNEGPLKNLHAQFNVVDLPLAYNGIFGRPFLYQSGAVTSIRLLILKITTSEGTIVVRGSQEMARECCMVATKEEESLSITTYAGIVVDEEEPRGAEPVGEMK